jgi:Protein of unknown function (DUF3443)
MKDYSRVLALAACATLSLLAACGGGGTSTTTPPNNIVTSGPNVAPITVSFGPDNNYANGGFTSVTVCVPGTSTCQTVDDVLVDTGSYGLRIVSSLLMIALPQQKTSSGDPVVECTQFLDTYTWGPVEAADIEIASEKASSVPIQVLSDTDYAAPSSCTDVSGGASADTVANLGANGLLGVGLFPQDCGSVCVAPTAGVTTPPDVYYTCPSSGCQASWQPLAQQVQNPVSLFATDNNGVIVELPAVSGAEATVSGSLVFGIGTESNNGLSGATVYTVDPTTGNFTTAFNGTTYTDESFIDSGSNGYFFPDPSISPCPSSSGAGGFYCPSGTANLSATNQGTTVGSGTVNFSVADAETLFDNNPNDAAFGDLGGPATDMFDWGLPFFYGRNVYVAIDGTTAPGGTTPFWAY